VAARILVGKLLVHYEAESDRETRYFDQYDREKPRVMPLGGPL
jgi:hypothetical protein